MKTGLLLAIGFALCLGASAQVIKVPSQGKHHTYSHRGLFMPKHGVRKAAHVSDTGGFNSNAGKSTVNKKKPV
ncbi:MAG: hypothetical protein JO301_01420 [Chitinophagaceae bacterium]|nr:hypothetical protein [Chitinophagaceae bacterium]